MWRLSTGSCTINALEAALQLQMGTSVSVGLIDKILNWISIRVEDIYPKVTRYRDNLNKIGLRQIDQRFGQCSEGCMRW